MATSKDYYTLLGVEKNASSEDIKKAFHKMARKYHPDNKDSGNEDRFKEVNEAYQTLSDNKRRAEYDSYGHVFGGGSGFSSQFGGFQGNFAGQDFNFGDIFSDLFGGATGGQVRRGRDISIDIQLQFNESIYGVTRGVLLVKTSLCETCNGSGGNIKTEFITCVTCNGQGRIHETRNSFLGAITSVRDCSTCHGEKRIPKEKCKLCHGLGVLKRQEEINIKVPAGIADGEVIRLSGMGEAVHGGISGDLYIKVHVARHHLFRREGNNLVMDLSIKLSDALLGGEYSINMLDGGVLKVKIPVNITFGEILRIRGKGVPNGRRGKGDILIKLNIELPKNLSRKSKELFKKLREEEGI